MPDIDDGNLICNRPVDGSIDVANHILLVFRDIVLNIDDDQSFFLHACLPQPIGAFFLQYNG